MPANNRIGAESAVTPVRVARALRGIAGPGVRRGAVGVAGRAACWPLKVGGREAGEPFAVVRRAQAAIGLSKNSSRVGVGLSVGTIGRQKAAGQARVVAALMGQVGASMRGKCHPRARSPSPHIVGREWHRYVRQVRLHRDRFPCQHLVGRARYRHVSQIPRGGQKGSKRWRFPNHHTRC
jgi:hypothetical protein